MQKSQDRGADAGNMPWQIHWLYTAEPHSVSGDFTPFKNSLLNAT